MARKQVKRFEVSHVHVGSVSEAWQVAGSYFPGDYEKDDRASACAGYPIYRSPSDWALYVCDLCTRLEVNLSNGDTVNIWIDDDDDAAAAPAAVADDGDALQVPAASTPAGSSAVAGADSAGSSESGAADPDLVTLRLRRSDVCRVSSALLGVKFDFIEEALPLQVDDPRRGVCIRSARAWDALRQEVRRQLQEHDARRGCGVDTWEVIA